MRDKPAIPGALDPSFSERVRDALLILMGRRNNRIGQLYLQKRASFAFGTFTRDMTAASGTQVISGVGFKPAALLILGGIVGGNMAGSAGFTGPAPATGLVSVGASLETALTGTNLVVMRTDHIAFIRTTNTDSQFAKLSEFFDDGFKLAWTKFNAPTGTATLAYLAFPDWSSDIVDTRTKVNEILELLHGPYK